MDDKLLQVKKALSVFVNASSNLDKLLAKREELYSRAIYISPQFNRTGSQHSKVPDKFAEGLAKVDMIDREINKVVSGYWQKQERVQNLINMLEPDYKTMLVLEWRYINGEAWENIARRLNMAPGYLYGLHRKGLEALADKIQKEDVTPDDYKKQAENQEKGNG